MRIPIAIILCLALYQTRVSRAEDISFSRQLAPILVRKCLGCHDNKKTEGRYALHTFEMFLKPGDSEESPIVAGAPNESYLYLKLTDSDEDLRMPQEDDALNHAELSLFKQWIEQGAKFDGPHESDRLVSLLPTRQHPLPPERYRTSIPIFAIKFSVDGKSLFTGGWQELLVWDVESSTLQQRITGLPQRIHCIDYSPDGRTLAVGGGAPGEYGEIRLIDMENVSEFDDIFERPAKQHELLATWEDVVLDLRFTPDGKSLVAGGADNSVRAYDLLDRDEIWSNTQHVDWVTAIDVTDYRFSERTISNDDLPDFFTLNENEKQSNSHLRQRWQFDSGRFIIREANWELEALAASNAEPAKSNSLTRITTSGIGKTYNVERETITGDAMQEHTATIEYLMRLQLMWPQDAGGSKFVLTSSKDRTVKVFMRSNGKLFTTYKGHRREYGPLAGLHRVFGVQAQPDTRRIWSGGEGKHFHGWDPITVRDEDGTAADMEARFAKEYSIDLLRHDFPDTVFSLLHGGSRLFGASANGEVREFAVAGPHASFDVERIATQQTYLGHTDQLYALDAHFANTPGESLVAAAGYTGEIVIWNAATGEVMTRFTATPSLR